MLRRGPNVRVCLLASVAAAAAPAAAHEGIAEGPAVRPGRAAPAGTPARAVATPDGWLAGRDYAQNLVRGVANDAARPLAEPVTREYERYAEIDPLPVPRSSSTEAVPLDGPSILSPAVQPQPLLSVPPILRVQAAQLERPAAGNPFRSESLTPDEPSAAETLRTGSANLPPALGPVDPLTADINRDIRQISADLAPRLDASVSLRGRSGPSGLGQLFDVETPIEASFSPAGYGRLKVTVTPAVLSSGRTDATNARLFGTNPLVAGGTAVSVGHTGLAVGAGLDVGYAYDIVSADVGSTPVGFRQTNVIGGIEVTPRLTNELLLRVSADRRAVTDSILAYGGFRDPRTGLSWGGVTRNRGHVQLEGSLGTANFYAGAGAAGVYGTNVKSNVEVEAGAGFSLPVYTTPTQEVRTGLSLVYFGYGRNLGNFTFGSGGYFSPQQFFAALVPFTYRQQLTPDLVYTVGGSIGVQTFRAKSTNVFPNNALQAQLAASGAATRFSGFRDLGPGGGANGEIDYRVNDNLHVGAKAGFDRSGNFTEGTGLVYARYVFNDPS